MQVHITPGVLESRAHTKKQFCLGKFKGEFVGVPVPVPTQEPGQNVAKEFARSQRGESIICQYFDWQNSLIERDNLALSVSSDDEEDQDIGGWGD